MEKGVKPRSVLGQKQRKIEKIAFECFFAVVFESILKSKPNFELLQK
jgi:hypothetical protein